MDEQDLLLTNEYVSTDIQKDLPPEFNNEFRNYYLNQVQNSKSEYVVDKITGLENQLQDETFDADNLLNTNNIINVGLNTQTSVRLQRERKTFVSIDSRNRDIISYPKPNFFKVYLGRTFSNVKSVKLASLEFPNTNAVINVGNNKLYWRNKEDVVNDVIDVKTRTYPIYEATIRTGSYILTTLQKEIISELQTIKRSFGQPQLFHYPDVVLDYDTDICTFQFLDLKLLNQNPFETAAASNQLTILYNDHPFLVGDVIYIRDAKTFADIPASEINSSFKVIFVERNKFRIETTTRASETKTSPNGGGGTAVKIGKALDFQFLFGENNNTISKNLGFPQRNSSDRIDAFMKYITQYYLVEIKTVEPHGLTNSELIINKDLVLLGAFNTAQTQGNKIVKIIDENTILIQPPNPTFKIPLTQEFNKIDTNIPKYLQFSYQSSNGNIVDITRMLSSLKRYSKDTIFVSTIYNHGFSLSDVGTSVFFYKTLTKPAINGENTIFSVMDNKNFFIEGLLEVNGGIGGLTGTDIVGVFSKRNPIHTITFDIIKDEDTDDWLTKTEFLPSINGESSVDLPAVSYFKISCSPVKINFGGGSYSTFNAGDILSAGDNIQFNNIKIEPTDQRVFKIASVVNDIIYVEYKQDSISNFELVGNPTIGTEFMFLLLPNHGFNKIINYKSITDAKTFNISKAKTENGSTLKIDYTPADRFRVGDIIDIQITDINYSRTNYTLTLSDIISNSSISVPESNEYDFTRTSNSIATIKFSPLTITSTVDDLNLNRLEITYTPPYTFQVGDKIKILNSDPDYILTSENIISETSIGIQKSDTYKFTQNPILPATIQFSEDAFEVTTVLDHNLNTGDSVRIKETGNPLLDSDIDWHNNITRLDEDTFLVYPEGKASESGTSGIIGMSNDFYLYECDSFAGIDANTYINNKKLTTYKIFPAEPTNGKNMFLFKINGAFATESIRGGGVNVFISSLKHGFNVKQDNTENDILHRSISLEGEQYVFLTCPTLNTIVSTGNIKDIFARISLTDNPGSVIFDAYLSNPKIFDDGSLPNLSDLEFSVKLFDGTLYDFTDLNYSFTLEIVEMVDYIENTNISSRRGVLEHVT